MKFLEKNIADDGLPCQKIDFIEEEFLNGALFVYLVKGLNILNRDDGEKDLSDPIAYLTLKGSKKFEEKKSKIIFDNLNPLWNEKFEFSL